MKFSATYRIFALAGIVLFLDQLTKWWIRSTFDLGQSVALISDVFHFTYVRNTGAAFSFLQNSNLLLAIIAGMVLGFLLYKLDDISKLSLPYHLCFGLIMGGTAGNLIDRVVHGAVIDFIDFRIWPVFNIADSALTISIIGLMYLLWKKK